MLLDIINHGDGCALSGVIAILLWLGSLAAGEQHQKWGGVLAVLAFLTYAGYALLVFRPESAEALFALSLRALIVSGLALGLSWLVLPLLAGFVEFAWPRLCALARSFGAWLVRRARGPNEQECKRRAAPDLEGARREAEENAQLQAEAQKRRDDARAGVEIFFALHRPEIEGRFPQAMLDDYLKRYMKDHLPADYVEERGRQLLAVLQKHVNKVIPPLQAQTFDEILKFFDDRMGRIRESLLDERDKEILLLQLDEEREHAVRKAIQEGRL